MLEDSTPWPGENLRKVVVLHASSVRTRSNSSIGGGLYEFSFRA
jgi:hypothetical protein